MIAALYVQTGGAYFGLSDVDPWDEPRDARNYAGPYSVVAHPPCQRYIALGNLNYARWGGEHNRPGNDGGCFASALASVRLWCGVLEHPANSQAWPMYGLLSPRSSWHGWIRCNATEWVCEVWQSAYGHRARKRTWLLYCGHDRPAELDWHRPRGEYQVGIGWAYREGRGKPVLSKHESNATPIAFRDALINLAKNACP